MTAVRDGGGGVCKTTAPKRANAAASCAPSMVTAVQRASQAASASTTGGSAATLTYSSRSDRGLHISRVDQAKSSVSLGADPQVVEGRCGNYFSEEIRKCRGRWAGGRPPGVRAVRVLSPPQRQLRVRTCASHSHLPFTHHAQSSSACIAMFGLQHTPSGRSAAMDVVRRRQS